MALLLLFFRGNPESNLSDEIAERDGTWVFTAKRIRVTRTALVGEDIVAVQDAYAKHDKRRTVIEASEEVEFTADDFAPQLEQAFELMPDALHWLGITKIDRMLSMSK